MNGDGACCAAQTKSDRLQRQPRRGGLVFVVFSSEFALRLRCPRPLVVCAVASASIGYWFGYVLSWYVAVSGERILANVNVD